MEDKIKTSNYSQGKIYKIVCNKTGLVYIGSTCRSLDERLKEHEYDSKRYLEKKTNIFISSIYVTFSKDCKIELIENYPCQNRKELEKKEYYYIANMECINIHRQSMSSYEYTKHQENISKLLIDKCGKDAIINILFRYGIDEFIKNKKK